MSNEELAAKIAKDLFTSRDGKRAFLILTCGEKWGGWSEAAAKSRIEEILNSGDKNAFLQKPCELFCKKCGSKEARRCYYKGGDEVYLGVGEDGNESYKNNPYVKRGRFEVKAKTEHIAHECKVCGFEWATEPLVKD